MDIEKAKKAAKWWTDHLRNGAKLDHGDHSPTGVMAIGLAAMVQEKEMEKITPEQIDNFEAVLGKKFEDRAEEHFYVSVDYGPDMFLLDAAKEAGIDLGMATLPWKTGMWVDGAEIKVSLGYRGAAEKI